MWLFLVFPSPSSEEPSNVLYIPCCLDMSNSFYGCQKVAFYPFQDWVRSFLPVSSGGNLSPRNKEHRNFSKKRTRNKEQTVHLLESFVPLLLRQPFPTDYQFPGGFFSHNFRKTWKWGKALSLTSRLLHFPDICLLSATSYTLCFSAGSPTRSWWPSQWEIWTGSWRCAAWTGTRSCRWSNGKLFIFFSSHEMHRQNCVSCHFLPFSKESDLAHFVLMVEL